MPSECLRRADLSAAAEWFRLPEPPAEAHLARAGFSTHLARLLALRGAENVSQAQRFLEPSLDQLHDPFLLAGLREAVDRLVAAHGKREAVAVVGDYDVDGVSASALLVAVFELCGLAVHSILPHRLREGYGFQPLHVDRAAENHCRLIVTVDCGVSAMAAVSYAHDRGIEVIITDHHLPGEDLPLGAIVVNPRQADCMYPFPDLAGVGLAFKLALGLCQVLGRTAPLESLLRMACLGTIADVVPLRGENRVIASLGLVALGTTKSLGLRALMESAGLRPPLSAADIGFRIGPRLNAAGRLSSPERALELLLTRDADRAQELARDLEAQNRLRQDEESLVVEQARQQIGAMAALPNAIVAWSREWHRGVVGIAAGKLARELSRPVILLAIDQDSATGSGRSIPALDLHELLQPLEFLMERFGGHSQAVGMTIQVGRLEELRESIGLASKALPAEMFKKRLDYDIELAPGEVDDDLLRELSRLEPHGAGNPQPLLRVGPLRLAGLPRHFGKGHLSAAANGPNNSRVNLLGWRWQERSADLQGEFEILAHLERDGYRQQPVLKLLDARQSASVR